MDLLENSPEIISETKTANPIFFVICEDWAAEFRAKYFIDDVCNRLGSESVINRNFWRLSLLRTPLLRERAAVEAREADAIVLALDKRTGVPAEVQKWLELVANGERPLPGLIGMVQEELIETDPPDRLVDYMHNVAEKAGAAFFCWNELSECNFEEIISNLVTLKP